MGKGVDGSQILHLVFDIETRSCDENTFSMIVDKL